MLTKKIVQRFGPSCKKLCPPSQQSHATGLQIIFIGIRSERCIRQEQVCVSYMCILDLFSLTTP